MRKKQKHLVYWIGGIVILIVILYQMDLLKLNSSSIVTLEEDYTGENGQYTCNPDASSCSITAMIECSDSTDTTVCTECMADTTSNPWRNKLVSGGYVLGANPPSKSLIKCVDEKNPKINAWMGCQGGIGWNCAGTYNNANGESSALIYKSSSQGGTYKLYDTIYPGDIVSVNGAGTNILYKATFQAECSSNECYSDAGWNECSNGKLVTNVNHPCILGKVCVDAPGINAECQDKVQCTTPTCNPAGTGWYECDSITKQQGTYHPCSTELGEVCRDASCVSSYSNEDFKFVVNGIEQNSKSIGVKIGDILTMKYKFYSDKLPSSTNLYFKVYKGTTVVSNTPDTYNPTLGNYDEVTMPIPGEGYYYVMIYTLINGKEVPMTSKSEFLFNVGIPLNLAVDVQSDAGTNLISGKPVYIYLYPTNLNNNPVEVDRNWKDVKIKFGGILQNTPVPKSDSSGNPLFENGKYTIIYASAPPGPMTVEATVYKNNIPSNTVIKDTLQISSPKLTAIVDNPTVLGQIPPNSERTIYFTVTDNSGMPQASTNSVRMTPKSCATPGLCNIILNSVPTETLGKYAVTYTFVEEGGYQLFILPSAPGYTNLEYQEIGTITVIEGAIEKECTSTTQCPDGTTCSNYKCVSNSPSYLKYLMYGVVVLILLIILVLIYKFMSKPKEEVYTGIGGL